MYDCFNLNKVIMNISYARKIENVPQIPNMKYQEFKSFF